MNTPTQFRPTLYLKDKCPFCLKLLILLLEGSKLPEVDVRVLKPDTDEDRDARALLSAHFEKVTFPAAQIGPDEYLKDSDALITHFSEKWNIDPTKLFVFNWYAEGPFASLGALYRENMELKAKLGS